MIDRCVAGEVRLIPVLLPGLDVLPDELLFLRPLNLVRFERSVSEREPVRQLVWGITGDRTPSRHAPNVLNAASAQARQAGVPDGTEPPDATGLLVRNQSR